MTRQPFPTLPGWKVIRDALDWNRYLLADLDIPIHSILHGSDARATATEVYVTALSGGAWGGVSIYNPLFFYILHSWSTDPNGIHFFTLRTEAESLLQSLRLAPDLPPPKVLDFP